MTVNVVDLEQLLADGRLRPQRPDPEVLAASLVAARADLAASEAILATSPQWAETMLYKTSATQVLFLQHVIASLKPGGRCGLVIDEGVLFRTTEAAFVQTKHKLLDDCDLQCIVSLPPGVFSSARA